MTNWEEQIELPEKDSDIEFAYILDSKKEPIKCDKEKLDHVLEYVDNVKYVATPNTDSFIIPGSDFETLQPILRKNEAEVKINIGIAIFVSFILGLMLLTFGVNTRDMSRSASSRFTLLVFGIIPLLNGLYELYSIRRVNESNYFRESSEIKFIHWIAQKKVHSIYVVAGVLVILTLFQYISGLKDSVELAGLVKPKVWQGEYWRLLTCILLHGGVMHLILNCAAIYAIGYMTIRVTGFSFFTIVFLFSGLTGSIASLLFSPNVASVGSSGGIMGLIGFLLVVSLKFNDKIPRKIVSSMLNSIVLVAILGALSYDIIDNAAHAGGLVGGILIGLLMVRKRKSMIPYKPSFRTNVLGAAAGIFLIIGVLIVIKQLLFA